MGVEGPGRRGRACRPEEGEADGHPGDDAGEVGPEAFVEDRGVSR